MRNRTEQPGNTRLLRVMNERLLLDHLRANGPTSRVELARLTGLSKPTVSAALAGLAEAGLARLVGEVSGRPGPVAALYDLNASAVYVLGVDIGREWIRVAVADLRGEMLARRDARNTAETAVAVVRRTRSLAHQVAGEAGVPWSSLACGVLGSPGVFDPRTGRVDFAPNLPGWSEPGLVDRLHRSLGLELVVENDVNLAAVGEHAYGHGRGKEHFVLVSIGTGVGMGIVINGQLYTGARGAAGEVSYLPAADAPGGSEEREHGPTEAVVAAPGIARAAQAAGLPYATAKEVFAAAEQGDAAARTLVEAEGRRIGGLVVAVAAVLDPEIVVLGGGVGRNVELLRDAISQRIAELGPLRPVVLASALNEGGVLSGAVARAADRAWNAVFAAR
ncbi:ROK family transcriptional regulator [Catellatospora tritici]|uniref:ROK family transcriptional regulator n=1 Tax=Catellatospora tritici TaxID=2851566 RepID=UPI001C2D594E|nr:ROK family transcriptional regulator [Catellatospora tritici]MBV1849337.1 ROK family transcriptional regulator [Catellatospora tritici]